MSMSSITAQTTHQPPGLLTACIAGEVKNEQTYPAVTTIHTDYMRMQAVTAHTLKWLKASLTTR